MIDYDLTVEIIKGVNEMEALADSVEDKVTRMLHRTGVSVMLVRSQIDRFVFNLPNSRFPPAYIEVISYNCYRAYCWKDKDRTLTHEGLVRHKLEEAVVDILDILVEYKWR